MSHIFADHMVVFCFGQRGCSILIFRPRGHFFVFRTAISPSSFLFNIRNIRNRVMIADINKVVPMQIFLAGFRRDTTIARLFQLDH